MTPSAVRPDRSASQAISMNDSGLPMSNEPRRVQAQNLGGAERHPPKRLGRRGEARAAPVDGDELRHLGQQSRLWGTRPRPCRAHRAGRARARCRAAGRRSPAGRWRSGSGRRWSACRQHVPLGRRHLEAVREDAHGVGAGRPAGTRPCSCHSRGTATCSTNAFSARCSLRCVCVRRPSAAAMADARRRSGDPTATANRSVTMTRGPNSAARRAGRARNLPCPCAGCRGSPGPSAPGPPTRTGTAGAGRRGRRARGRSDRPRRRPRPAPAHRRRRRG